MTALSLLLTGTNSAQGSSRQIKLIKLTLKRRKLETDRLTQE